MAHQVKAWGKQSAGAVEPEPLESLRRDSEQTEMNYELQPAMSLTRVDSDTLLVRFPLIVTRESSQAPNLHGSLETSTGLP